MKLADLFDQTSAHRFLTTHANLAPEPAARPARYTSVLYQISPSRVADFLWSLVSVRHIRFRTCQTVCDVVRSNDPNPSFWKDDAIEIIVDANNDRANVNTDQADQFFNDYGGHNYVNYEGRVSRWDEDFEQPLVGWANADDWSWGEGEEIYGVGNETATGWALEAKFHKSQFEDPSTGNKLVPGYKMGFNIGMDDDDGADLEIQYWWANRQRPLEFDAIALEDGETIADYPPEEYDWVIDATGRLTHGGTGEIILGGLSLPGDFNANGMLDGPDIDDLTGRVADGDNPAAYDLNNDSLVNDADIRVWIKDLYNSWEMINVIGNHQI